MTDNFQQLLGKVVAIDCGEDGYFQGRLAKIELDPDSKSLILANAFNAGVSCGRAPIRIDGEKVISMKVLEVGGVSEKIESAPVKPEKVQKKPARKVAPNNSKDTTTSSSILDKLLSAEQTAKNVDLPIKPQELIESSLKNMENSSSKSVLSKLFITEESINEIVAKTKPHELADRSLKTVESSTKKILSCSEIESSCSYNQRTLDVKEGSIATTSKSTPTILIAPVKPHGWVDRPLKNMDNFTKSFSSYSDVESSNSYKQRILDVELDSETSKDISSTPSVLSKLFSTAQTSKVVAPIRPQVDHSLKNVEISTKIPSSSSDIDSSSGEKQNQQKVVNKKRPSRNAKKKEVKVVHEVKSTPTPHFKRYEPQIPQPQRLSAPAWAVKSTRRGLGPCGIPILDVQNGYGPISHRDAHLDKAIDFDELAEDFDFATNLQLFDKENVEADDEDFYESIEKPKMSQNFKHDENIISDPTRTTSWTNVVAKNGFIDNTSAERESSSVMMSFCPSSFLAVPSGSRVPVIDENLKRKYLKSCVAYLGHENYSSVVADRLLQFFNEILSTENHGKPAKITVIGSSSDAEIGSNLISRLSARSHKVYVLGEVAANSNVNCISVADTKKLPSDIDYIFCLHKIIPEDILKYLNSHKEIHIISLEFLPSLVDLSKIHVLMIGLATAGISSMPTALATGKTTFEVLCGAKSSTIDCCIADIGVPFDWIVDGGKEALSTVFFNSVLVRL